MERAATNTPRRSRRVAAVLGLGVMGAAAVWGLGIGTSADADQTPHKVTLCHATDSYTNPYVSVTVDYNAVVLGGHGGHEGPVFDPSVQNGTKWGDIIPAFDFGNGNQYGGMNLDAVGQSILASNCTLVPSTTTTTGGA